MTNKELILIPGKLYRLKDEQYFYRGLVPDDQPGPGRHYLLSAPDVGSILMFIRKVEYYDKTFITQEEKLDIVRWIFLWEDKLLWTQAQTWNYDFGRVPRILERC